MAAGGSVQAGSGWTCGIHEQCGPGPTEATDSKSPNGSPVRTTMGSTRYWPRCVSGTRAAQVREVRGRSEMTRPGMATGSVDGLCVSSQGLGRRADERSV